MTVLTMSEQILNNIAKVEVVKAPKNFFYCSSHTNAKCQFPSNLIDTDLWPEGAIVRWWRTPRPKIVSDTTVYHDAPSSPQIISDETMRNIPLPRMSLSQAPPKAGNADGERSVHSEEQLPSSSDLERNPAVSDKTMMEITYENQQEEAPAALLVPPAPQRSPIRTRSRTRIERKDVDADRSRSQIDLHRARSN